MNTILNNILKDYRSHLNDKDECFLLKEYKYNDIKTIDYSIIIPVYNQEQIIVNNLNAILKYTGGTFEIIIILDFCYDNTEINIINFLNCYSHFNNSLNSIKIFKQPNSPIFEASCDNIGFISSRGKYCLEIQADMEMTEFNYNIHMTKPFNILNNVFAVSGRCAHNIFNHDKGIGKLGGLIIKSIEDLGLNKNKFYTFETCNRGPLLIEKEKLRLLNFLDEKNYYLDDSDHDIIIRAYLKYKFISGYVPINFNSPLTHGSTRKISLNKHEEINSKYKQLRIEQQFKNANYNLNNVSIGKYKNVWKELEPIEYSI